MSPESEYSDLVKTALEASVYVAPLDHGLTMEELKKVAERFGRGAGPLLDTIRKLDHVTNESGRWKLGRGTWHGHEFFMFGRWEPTDPRNFDALDLPLNELQRRWEVIGPDKECISREEAVSLGAAEGISTKDMNVAFELLLLAEWLVPGDGLSFKRGRVAGRDARPGKLVASFKKDSRPRALLAKILPLVTSVIGERSSVNAPTSTNERVGNVPKGAVVSEIQKVPGASETKPAVFIGSSVKGLSVARDIQLLLDHDLNFTIWSQGVFGLSSGTLESLVKATDKFDFAVLVVTPDDVTTKRSDQGPRNSPRDNVVFELGLFMGALGRDRVYIVRPRDVDIEMPSDLAGITPADYDPNREDQHAALGAASTRILREIQASWKTDGKRRR